MSERIQLQGMLAEKRLKLKELVNRADALVRGIHTQCNPFLPVAELLVDQISSQGNDLKRLVHKIGHLAQDIRALQDELGIEDDE